MRLATSILIPLLLAACVSAPDGATSPPLTTQNSQTPTTYARETTPIEKSGTFHPRDETLGAYDAALITNIQKRWYDLLEKSKFKSSDKGAITVQFRLELDGRVTDFKITSNELTTAMAELCERAVLELAPFPPVPAAYLSTFKKDHREVRFTFHLN